MNTTTPDPQDVAVSVSFLEQLANKPASYWGSRLPSDIRVVLRFLASVIAERDQAHQKLADAPHGWACDFNVVPGIDRVPDDADCTCWKAGL